MKLTLTDDEGTVLDAVTFDREEWDQAQRRSTAAINLICSLDAGKDAQ